MRGSWVVVLLAAAWPVATIRGEDKAATDAGRLEGRWKVVALESEGRKATEADLERMKEGGWVFKGPEVTFVTPGAPTATSAYKVDPGKSPKEFDLTGLSGLEKGKTLLGIYKIEGGRLTICLRDEGSAAKGRPTGFAADPAAGLSVIAFERPDAPRPPSPSAPGKP